jgi:nucleotide-binding universal stress UspA family protein
MAVQIPIVQDAELRRSTRSGLAALRVRPIRRIAVGVDSFAEGEDAAVLGSALARASGAELMLVNVHSAPLLPAPAGFDWRSTRNESQRTLRGVRDAFAPKARTVTTSDYSVARALDRVVRRHHRDLLVVGSSRHAVEGHVRIATRTRQLLGEFHCALAIAPLGLHTQPEPTLRRIGVGYDGGREAEAALALAGQVALAAGAELHVRGVVDDRIPALARSAMNALVATEWQGVVGQEVEELHDRCLTAAHRTGAKVRAEVLRGRPADALLALSEHVDLLVIGSRRWGPAARVLLGSTGEAVLHDAACSVLAVPRPGR